ncbi:MAG TPA: hypothetical protein VNJ09_03360 [Chthonomonadales bacterium]|nr:hypothetical protein [Chthonomonadales bacterium]
MVRDEFDNRTKEILAHRVGYRCSNPNCRKLTSGPQEDPTKAVNIGVAAHITAASQGGPRYDAGLTSEERKSIDNGIWLCQNCAKLVDNDKQRYTADLLRNWKKLSEQAALLEVENLSPPSQDSVIEDIELLRFYSQCFDRPAFQDPFRREGSMEAFDRAIEDTIIAINTGALRARDGTILAQSKGKSYLSNHKWREKMDTIVDLLRAIRSRYSLAVQTGQIWLGPERDGRQPYGIRNKEVAEWMDSTRAEIVKLFSELCEEAGIPPLHFPRPFRKGWDHYW